jgi:hypothetical protein
MSKITFPGGAGGGAGGSAAGVSTINGASGALTFVGQSGLSVYTSGTTLHFDAAGAAVDSRAATGDIVPDTNDAYSLGASNLSFSSGVFQELIVESGATSGVRFRYSDPWILIRNIQDNAYHGIVADEFRTNPYNASLTGSIFRMRESGTIRWSNTTTATGTRDVTLSRKSAGTLQVGSGDATNALGAIEAQSGTFPSGIVLAAPNGSGWQLTVDNNGVLTTTGPFVLG